MATNIELVQQLYVAYFNRPGDVGGVNFYAEVLEKNLTTIDAIAADFAKSAEYQAQFAGKQAEVVIDIVYMNMFGRHAEKAALDFYGPKIQAGIITIDKVVTDIVKGAQGTDQVAYDSKVAAAVEFTNFLDTAGNESARLAYLSGEGDVLQIARDYLIEVTDEASLATAVAGLANTGAELIGELNEGQTIVLTKALDTANGGAGNDTILGAISGNAELNTYSILDVINGGAGIDTLKLLEDTGNAVSLGNMSNVEIVEMTGTKAVSVNTSATTGLTDLNVVKTGGAVAATAAGTTNIKVDVQQATAVAGDSTATPAVADVKADIAINGGKDVTLNVTGVKQVLDVVADASAELNAIKVGGQTAAKGAVTVNSTGVAAVKGTNVTMSSITVTGGTTVSVTQKASGDTSGLIAGTNADKAVHTQGAVNVNAGTETTTVTVKQDAAVSALSRAAVAGVDEVATVTFTKLDDGQSVTVGGLTFTANKDLTAAQVAAAFANLSDEAFAPGVATGDTNGGSARANGVFSGSLATYWHSGAVNGSTVTFTGSGAMDDLHLSSAGVTPVTTTQGVDGTSAQNRLGVANGLVTIAGASGLKTVTVDGFATNSTITGAANTALASISLANGGNFAVTNAATSLTVSTNKVNGTVDVQSGTKTLTVNVTSGSTDSVTLKSASADTVNVGGTGTVIGNTATGLTAAVSINTSAMTAGSATFTINDGAATSYTGGAGVDSVDVNNAGTAIAKAIDLGAGNDKLTLVGTVVTPTATLKGGAGTDTIAMNGESAAAVSASAAFADKIDGFEKLSITDLVTTARTVNMANMDGITYVISNNATASASSVGSKQIYSFDIAGLVLDNTGTLKAGGVTLYTAGADDVAAATIATGLTSPVTINGVSYVVTNPAGTQIVLTSSANVAPQPAISLTTTVQDTAMSNAGVTTTPGAADVVGGTSFLTIDKMANNGTLELVGSGDGVVVKMADASGSADSFNIVTKLNASDVTAGTVDVAGVESLKYTSTDVTPTDSSGNRTIQTADLILKADKATTLTIDGNSDVVLDLAAATTSLATINASALTGNLEYAANGFVAMTITGGSGHDTLAASVGATAKADVIVGGAGQDTITAGANGATLTGGADQDMFILTATAADAGTKEGNTYNTITDFAAGDLLKLEHFDGTVKNAVDFLKLTAVLNENTATFSNFLDAATVQATLGQAVYFNYKGDTYVVVDSGAESATAFENGKDLVIKLTGINGDNLSWNEDFGTVALI